MTLTLGDKSANTRPFRSGGVLDREVEELGPVRNVPGQAVHLLHARRPEVQASAPQRQSLEGELAKLPRTRWLVSGSHRR